MKVELDRKGIISLLRGTTPPYSVMNKIPKELGSYTGGFVDKWNWNYIDENVPKILNPGEFPEIENTVYNYLWLLVKALAIKNTVLEFISLVLKCKISLNA